MKFGYLVLIAFALCRTAYSGPVLREAESSWIDELETQEKIREKRKIELLQHLQDGGVGIVREEGEKVVAEEQSSPVPDVPPEAEAEEPSPQDEGTRAKKQAPDHVCIKEVGGKTSCGRVISARGPSSRLLARGDPSAYSTGDHSSKVDTKYPSMQARTFDILPVNPLASALTYAVPAVPAVPAAAATAFTADAGAAAIGHAIRTVPVAPIAHVEPISLNLLPHSIPIHPMLHTAMLAHRPLVNLQRLEVPKIPEIIYAPAEVKQPAYEMKPVVTRPETPYAYPTRYGVVGSGLDGPMICHPYDEKLAQQVIQIRPEVHVIEGAGKTINSTVEEFKSSGGMEEEEGRLNDHIRTVNQIREDINQLNRAAQTILDQQERLAEMQQRHIWQRDEKSPFSERAYLSYGVPPTSVYMVPPTSSRASALSFPTSPEDVKFFMNLLHAGKKIGALSESFQPTLATVLSEAEKLVQSDPSQSRREPQNQKQSKTSSTNGSGSKPEKISMA